MFQGANEISQHRLCGEVGLGCVEKDFRQGCPVTLDGTNTALPILVEMKEEVTNLLWSSCHWVGGIFRAPLGKVCPPSLVHFLGGLAYCLCSLLCNRCRKPLSPQCTGDRFQACRLSASGFRWNRLFRGCFSRSGRGGS